MSGALKAPAVRTGPSMRRHKSAQDYRTPRVFLDAVEKRFGPIEFDLAATAEARVAATGYFGPDHRNPDSRDALARDWSGFGGTLWLNPPFGDVRPWAKKCAEYSHREGFLLLLVPASVATEWYAEHVHGKAFVMPLRGRLTFVGQTDPYPRDLLLAAYGYGLTGFEPWKWRSL